MEERVFTKRCGVDITDEETRKEFVNDNSPPARDIPDSEPPSASMTRSDLPLLYPLSIANPTHALEPLLEPMRAFDAITIAS
jgi:hypothetical protein